MDPFDEFEIKPLSEGLGFHKKSIPLAEQIKKSGLIEANSAQIPVLSQEEKEKMQPAANKPQAFTDLLKALESPVATRPSNPPRASASTSEVLITEPLPAPGTSKKRAMEIELPRPTGPEFPNLNPRPSASPLNKVVENVGLKRGAADSPVTLLECASASVPAAILDGIVVFALSLMFLVALMTVTRVDLTTLVFDVGLDFPTQVAFGILFSSVLIMYMVVVRSFFGRTLGEWTFDHQMGDDQQHGQAVYPLKVLARTLVLIVTGIVTLPFLSLIFRKDLLAPLSGLQLYRSR